MVAPHNFHRWASSYLEKGGLSGDQADIDAMYDENLTYGENQANFASQHPIESIERRVGAYSERQQRRIEKETAKQVAGEEYEHLEGDTSFKAHARRAKLRKEYGLEEVGEPEYTNEPSPNVVKKELELQDVATIKRKQGIGEKTVEGAKTLVGRLISKSRDMLAHREEIRVKLNKVASRTPFASPHPGSQIGYINLGLGGQQAQQQPALVPRERTLYVGGRKHTYIEMVKSRKQKSQGVGPNLSIGSAQPQYQSQIGYLNFSLGSPSGGFGGINKGASFGRIGKGRAFSLGRVGKRKQKIRWL